MPVRIYEIAKKTGIPSKDVLAKAKELGITNAKVASSTLDKITAEYLEEQITGTKEPEYIEEVVSSIPLSLTATLCAPAIPLVGSTTRNRGATDRPYLKASAEIKRTSY